MRIWVLSWSFYQLVIYFHHPLYVEIFRGFKGRKIAICEIASNQNILFKGELYSIQPKNVSELEYLSITNVIKYSIDTGKTQFHQNERTVFSFTNNDSVLSIPYREINNFNIWLLKDLSISSYELKNEHNIETLLWYVRLHLKYRRYENPTKVISEAYAHGSRNLKVDQKLDFLIKLYVIINSFYPKRRIDINRSIRRKLICSIYKNLKRELKKSHPDIDFHNFCKTNHW